MDKSDTQLAFDCIKNSQTIFKLKRKQRFKRHTYAFAQFCVTILGCLNGGGQIRADDKETAKDMLERVKLLYNSLPNRNPLENPYVQKLYTDWLGGTDTEKAQSALHTEYHEVEKLTNALNIKW